MNLDLKRYRAVCLHGLLLAVIPVLLFAQFPDSTIVYKSVDSVQLRLHFFFPSDWSPADQRAAIGSSGDESSVSRARKTLKQYASPVANNVFVALEALNAIDALGAAAIPLHEYLHTLPRTDPAAPERLNSYVGRLLEKILS